MFGDRAQWRTAWTGLLTGKALIIADLVGAPHGWVLEVAGVSTGLAALAGLWWLTEREHRQLRAHLAGFDAAWAAVGRGLPDGQPESRPGRHREDAGNVRWLPRREGPSGRGRARSNSG